jgi:LCP family protein required for cell wall assembly
MRLRLAITVLFFGTLVGCQTGAVQPAPVATELHRLEVYIPTITPTPFQPLWPTGIPSPTPQPSPTLTPTAAPSATVKPSALLESLAPLLQGRDHVNILLLGSDSRGGQYYRTDSIIIVSVRPAEQLVTMISVPRDLYVEIPTWGFDKINTAVLRGELNGYRGGGMQLLQDTLELNLGLEIDHFVLVDFQGFQQIVDTIGGIEIPVACPFTEWYIKDRKVSAELESNWYLRTIGPGIVHMDGFTALWYSRARLRSTDTDRSRRQQEVLRAIYSKALSLDMVPEIPALYEDFRQTVDTDVSLETALRFVPMGLAIDKAQIRSYYIWTNVGQIGYTAGGAWVLIPDRAAAQAFVSKVINEPPSAEAVKAVQRVEIWDAGAGEEKRLLASDRLAFGGYASEHTRDVDDRQPGSYLVILSDVISESQIEEMRLLLGFGRDQIQERPNAAGDYDFRLILGEEYNTCFNSAKVDR